jgi:hypothetical protein
MYMRSYHEWRCGGRVKEGSRLKYEEIFEQAGGGKVVFELSNTGGDKSHIT